MTAVYPTRRSLVHGWDLLLTLVARDVKLRYRRSALGVAWSLLNPLLQLLVFQFVFSTLLPLRVPDYTVFLFIGILVWGWFQSSLMAATSAVIDNGLLIRQPGFPESVLPVVAVVSNLVNFVLAFPILLIFLLLGGHVPTQAVLALPCIITVQLVFTLSLAYLLAGVHVRFRDTQYLMGVVLMLGFYLVPVFYDTRTVPQKYQTLYGLNPMVHVLNAYRDVLIHGRSPEWKPLLLISAASLAIMTCTFMIFNRASHRFIEEL
jgi:lipopolysaccharide transport system permease protein